ncbi:MAG TPA: cupin domain-containing protein [Polyangia bacterium]|nr:cupin domain-containing protein [Polyangia bacterium]
MTLSIQKELVQASDALKIVRLQIPAGAAVPEHHANVDVVVTVVRGTGTFTVGTGKRAIRPGEVVVMPPKAPHAIAAETDLELVVVHARLAPAGEPAGCGA